MTVRELLAVIPSRIQEISIRLYPMGKIEHDPGDLSLYPVERFRGEVYVAKESNNNYLDHTVVEIWISNIGEILIKCI